MYLVDYHVHTKRCGHASGEDREFVEAAIAQGLAEIGFADHVPCYYRDFPNPSRIPVHDRGMAAAALDEYVASIIKLQAEYREIQIKLGLEVDFAPGWEEAVTRLVAPYPWDYLLGSVHFIADWNLDYIIHEKERPPVEIFPAYFEQVAATADCGLFDALVHLDLPRRAFPGLEPEQMQQLYQTLAVRLGRAKAVVELNTRGVYEFFRTKEGLDPDLLLLRLCREQGVQVILGSDGHQPAQVGAEFGAAQELLRQVGYDRITVFNRRQAALVKWEQ